MNGSVNYEGRSQHIGDNNFTPLSSLETAIEQVKKSWEGDDQLIDILEDLADFINVHPEREVIGLEVKLEKGNRSDLYKRAKELKSKFSRRVAKNQMSATEQQVYIQVLSFISTTWFQCIHPKIIAGISSEDLDQIVNDELIKPVHQAVVRFDSTVTSETVTGMIYYLTGNCHLVWDSEC
ncbi:hypothetical protein NBRC116583_08660 [Arenicella sp. 4NH20-0111]|uniref:ABC-three component system protein n=1 Tax=Arenicella sp. 4NH20-0111 TaxID=3127648 RepID=UPI003103C981